MSVAGCFGQFTLTRKVYDFNSSVVDNPFVQSILMWVMCIVPVYPFAAWIDVVILNLLEFWTGSNPLAMNENQVETQRFAHEGVEYDITASKNRFDFSEVNNPENSFALKFDTTDGSWNLHKDGELIKITQQAGNELRLFNFDGVLLETKLTY
jgi:hypothetical protein